MVQVDPFDTKLHHSGVSGRDVTYATTPTGMADAQPVQAHYYLTDD